METATQQETVKFYSWIEKEPSSLTIHIEGGGMVHADGKVIIKDPLHDVRFNKGLLVTSHPKVIEVLRRMISQGENITEDHEVYLSHVLSDKAQAERGAKKMAILASEGASLRAENEALKAKLAKRGGKLGQADDNAATPAA